MDHHTGGTSLTDITQVRDYTEAVKGQLHASEAAYRDMKTPFIRASWLIQRIWVFHIPAYRAD